MILRWFLATGYLLRRLLWWRQRAEVPQLSRHEQCLHEIDRLERELGLLSALSDSEFDEQVRRAVWHPSADHPPHNCGIPHCIWHDT